MNRAGATVVMFFCLVVVASSAQSSRAQPPSYEEAHLLRELTDPNWESRSDAFDGLLLLGTLANPSDEVKMALINLLERETDVLRHDDTGFDEASRGEGEGEYYLHVVAKVAEFRDVRALHALLGAMTTGNVVTQALAGFGTIAFDPVIEKLQSNSDFERVAAAEVLGNMLESNSGATLDGAARGRAVQLLIGTLNDESYGVRIAGIRALAKSRDSRVMPLIEDVKAHDPYEPRAGLYPVRREAAKVLEELNKAGDK